jgi:uncharacterized protein YecT (DUF1311 family)
VKRRVERRADYEELDLKERLLKINKEMREQNLTPDQLHELGQSLRRKLNRRTSSENTKSDVVALLEGASGRIITQAEMNRTSFQDFEKADLELRQIYERVSSMLEPDDLKRLEESQKAWRSFRDKQVKLAGGFYEGGSIQPLIHNVEAHAQTEARIKELHGICDELQSR